MLTAVSVVRQCRPTVWAISGNSSLLPKINLLLTLTLTLTINLRDKTKK